MKKYLLLFLIAIPLAFHSLAQCPLDAPTINPGDVIVCAPQTYTFSAEIVSNVTYQWKLNGTNISGATNNAYTAAASGKYTVEISNGVCNSAESMPTVLTVIERPLANAGPDQYVLANSVVTLAASGGALYSWSPQEGLSNPYIENPTTVMSKTIEFMVTVSDASNTCQNQDAVMIYVSNTLSGAFSTSINGPVPIAPGQKNASYGVPNQTGFAYAWALTGGTITSGQNTNSVTVDWDAPAAGSDNSRIATPPYSISLTETNTSNQKKTTTIDVSPTTTSISKSLSQSGITLFPNPTSESFNIEMPESGVAVKYEILDLTGTSVAQGNFISTSTAEKITTNFGAGMYQIVLRYNDVVTCGRLSKVQ